MHPLKLGRFPLTFEKKDLTPMNWSEQLAQVNAGNRKTLARLISWVENEQAGYTDLLQSLPEGHTPVIGITGPPGAGKSTLVDKLIGHAIQAGKKVAVLCVDPSSPFHQGAILGDRIRLTTWYTHPQVYIRSLASRGSLGGLHPKIIEINELLQQAGFDLVFIETVGVGQSEVEIAALADVTAVVLVPEAGDEIQTMKAGLMEVADVFIVNKADRPDATRFVNHLKQMLAPAFARQQKEIPILATTATSNEGVEIVFQTLLTLAVQENENKNWLLAERAYRLLEARRMKGSSRAQLLEKIKAAKTKGAFNLYQFVSEL
jgi:LAO/AO transport system kinase